MGQEDNTILIKKYRNRRLYDMQEKRYITLEELTEKIQNGAQVKVIDSSTEEDITQSVLIQIILDSQKNSGYDLFTNQLLHQLIQYRDHSTSEFFQNYLPRILEGYVDWQRQTQSQFMNWAQLGWQANPFMAMKEMPMPGFGLWNMPPFGPSSSSRNSETTETRPTQPEETQETVAEMQKKIEELEERLKKKPKKG